VLTVVRTLLGWMEGSLPVGQGGPGGILVTVLVAVLLWLLLDLRRTARASLASFPTLLDTTPGELARFESRRSPCRS
jgi:hypothetical protein